MIKVPIKVFKNGEFIQECESIQDAGQWLKDHTGDKFFRFTKIERGYCYGESWDFNGARYKFMAAEKDASRRKQELEAKKH